MYRIRFHGRGGQGLKRAGRILGTALFRAGLEVQDAPRYGAERRGAPIFAYVRASRSPIHERGVISCPDLLIIADPHLLAMPDSGVLAGATTRTVVLLHTGEPVSLWRERLDLPGPLLILPRLPGEEERFRGAVCAGGAAALLTELDEGLLARAISEELAHLSAELIMTSLGLARAAHAALAGERGIVRQEEPISAAGYKTPAWLTLACEEAAVSAPAIHAAATSELSQTGLWRGKRPVIDPGRCRGCWWLCATFCPERVIAVDANRRPRIDYGHCKGCLICLRQCPHHAISAVPEEEAAREEKA